MRALIAELLRLADGGRISRAAYSEAISRAGLPARNYAQLTAAMQTHDIEVVDPEPPSGGDPGAFHQADDDSNNRQAHDPGWEVNGFDYFLKQNWHSVLDTTEEHALAVRMQQGRLAELALNEGDAPEDARRDLQRWVRVGRRAEETLVRHNLRLVANIAWKHQRQIGPALEIEDLFQEGVLGLIHALSKFDPDKGFKLSTYATWWIRQSITRAIADKQRAIRLPVHKWEETRRVWRTAEALRAQGRPATPSAVAKALGMKVAAVREIQRVGQPLASLDRPAARSTIPTGWLLPDPDGRDPSELLERRQLAEAVHALLEGLTERERQVVLLRNGFVDGETKTLEEVGQMFGVTRERIRQIEAKTLAKLRNPARTKAIREFVNFADDLDAKRAKDEERRRAGYLPSKIERS